MDVEKALLYFSTTLTLVLIVAMFAYFSVGAYSFYNSRFNGYPSSALPPFLYHGNVYLSSGWTVVVYSNGALTVGLLFPALLVLVVFLEALLNIRPSTA